MTRSDGYAVDLDAVDAAGAAAGRLSRETGAVPLGQACPPSAFGHDELAESAGRFHESWRDGLTRLAEETDALARGLGATAAAYRETEEAVAATFDRVGEDRGR